MHGFKSFKDRTTIHFDDGITGIVGPNGCGKSNIVDALFWVMGEQSAKHLRGGSMQDLIFSGSSKYSPGSWAEVSLVLDNEEKKHIHIGNKVVQPLEIQLTRKLYRNGESEYRINDVPCRLKDIQEVFMDTGSGSKSYSIIAQGEISRLVQAKPEDRRSIIEEVAGVTKFKVRKKESLRKMEQTADNLARLTDLKTEVSKNLNSLEQQAGKAEKAKELREKSEKNELIVGSHKEYHFLKEFSEKAQKTFEQEVEVGEAQAQKNNLELSLEQEKIQKTMLTLEVDEAQKNFSFSGQALAALEERTTHLKRALGEKNNFLQAAFGEEQELKAEQELALHKIAELKSSFEEFTARGQNTQDFEIQTKELEELKNNLAEKEKKAHDLQKKREELSKAITALEQDLFRCKTRKDELSAGLQDASLEIEALEEQYSKVSSSMAFERENLKVRLDVVQTLNTAVEELKLKLKLKLEEEKIIDENFRQATGDLIGFESRLQSLQEFNKNLEGVKKGSKEIIALYPEAQMVGGLIECAEGFEQAINALCGSTFETIIAPAFDTILSAKNHQHSFDMLKSYAQDAGHITSTLNNLKSLFNQNVMDIPALLTSTQDIKDLFAGFYVVPELSMEDFKKDFSSIMFNGLVSKDGKVLIRKNYTTQKLEVCQGEDFKQSILERNNIIRSLQAKIDEKKIELETITNNRNELKQLLQSLRLENEQKTFELADKKAQHTAQESALKSKESHYDSLSSRVKILTQRKIQISSQRIEMLEKEEALNKEIHVKREALQSMITEEDALKVDLQQSTASYSEKYESYVRLEIERNNYEEKNKEFTTRLDDLEQESKRREKKLEVLGHSQITRQEEILLAQKELEQTDEKIKELAGQVASFEEVLKKKKEELHILLDSFEQKEKNLRNLDKTISEKEKENIENQLRLQQIVQQEEELCRDIFERYRIDMRENLSMYLELDPEVLTHFNSLESMYTTQTAEGISTIQKVSYTFEKLQPHQVREADEKFKKNKQELSRMGEINWQAIEDFNRQKLRLDFLNAQEEELKKSLTDLQSAITHIDERSKERFFEAFTEVNSRFAQIFPIIFGGGSAKLEIVGSVDDPECGIDIHAQPPGKRMQNLNLMSGGEKAMTALSLIFSIFLVKPSPFCLLDEVDAPLDDANVGRFNDLLREMSGQSQFILITHNKKTMELNDCLYGVTMQEPGISNAVSVQLQ